MDVIAYHEAGHAFMAIYLGARVRSVTIDPDWDDGPQRSGDTAVEWDLYGFEEREIHEKSVIVALAGPAAEIAYTGEPYHPGFVQEWSGDWMTAMQVASTLIRKEERRLVWLEEITRCLVGLFDATVHWSAIAEIADHLLAHETLYSEEIDHIVRTWLTAIPGPRAWPLPNQRFDVA